MRKGFFARTAAIIFSCITMLWMMPFDLLHTSAADEIIDLFFLDDTYSEYISIPDDVPTSFQLPKGVKVQSSGYSHVKVSADGLIEPYAEEIYYIGYGYIYEYNPGTDELIGSDGVKYTVNVRDYAEYYAYGVIDDYMDENISDDMTDYEKLKAVCKFVAGYAYSGYNSGLVPMIVTGEGGDCWASTGAVIYMCNKLGFKARARNAANDPGAGQGHHNNVVQTTDGTCYLVDCGLNEAAPRNYTLSKLDKPFKSKKLSSTTAEITDYLGFDTEIVVPSEIGGRTVVSVGASAFSDANKELDGAITSVTLPDTIESIGDSAFWDMKNLLRINIPASVSRIDKAAFCDCDNVVMTIDPDNEYFTLKDDILYSKDMKTLVGAVGFNKKDASGQRIKRDVSVPEGVEIISDEAFYDCSSLGSIRLPSTVRDIGYMAFGKTTLQGTLELPESLEGIGYRALRGVDSSVLVIRSSDLVINNTKENDLYLSEDGSTLACSWTAATAVIAPKDSTAQEYCEKYAKYSSGKTRYIFCELPENGKSVEIINGTVKNTDGELCDWSYSWNETDGAVMEIKGRGKIAELDMTFPFRSADTLRLSADITELSDDVLSRLKGISNVIGDGSYASELSAELGASLNGKASAIAGDMNGDGTLTIADCVIMQRWLINDGDMENWSAGDLVCDGVIDIFDYVALKKRVLI